MKLRHLNIGDVFSFYVSDYVIKLLYIPDDPLGQYKCKVISHPDHQDFDGLYLFIPGDQDVKVAAGDEYEDTEL